MSRAAAHCSIQMSEILALLRGERPRLVSHGVRRLIVLVRKRVFDVGKPVVHALDSLGPRLSEGTTSSRHDNGGDDHPRAATAGGYDSQTS